MQAPTPVRLAGLLVTAEGAAVALVGAGYVMAGVVAEPEDRLASVLAGLLALSVGLVLVPVGRALGRTRGAAFAPSVLTQLFLLVVGSGLVQGGVYTVAVPVLLVAGAVLFQLLTPASRDAFRGAG